VNVLKGCQNITFRFPFYNDTDFMFLAIGEVPLLTSHQTPWWSVRHPTVIFVFILIFPKSISFTRQLPFNYRTSHIHQCWIRGWRKIRNVKCLFTRLYGGICEKT